MGMRKKKDWRKISKFLAFVVGRWSCHSLSEMAKFRGRTRLEENEEFEHAMFVSP